MEVEAENRIRVSIRSIAECGRSDGDVVTAQLECLKDEVPCILAVNDRAVCLFVNHQLAEFFGRTSQYVAVLSETIEALRKFTTAPPRKRGESFVQLGEAVAQAQEMLRVAVCAMEAASSTCSPAALARLSYDEEQQKPHEMN